MTACRQSRSSHRKGGAGKTTLALNLAVASELAGCPAVVVDIDPQASAAAWGDSREGETPVVVSAQAARLAEVLATAREHGAELCIIDTAPHAQTDALNAARAAGLDVAPVRIGHRAAFVHAATAGAGVLEHAPESKAAEEVRALYAWVVEAMSRTEERAA